MNPLTTSAFDLTDHLTAKADPTLPRVLVMHHNLLRGDMSKRMGLARWKRAQRRVVDELRQLKERLHQGLERCSWEDRRAIVELLRRKNIPEAVSPGPSAAAAS